MNAPGQSWARFRLAGSTSDSGGGYASIISAFSGNSPDQDYYYTAGQQIMVGDTPYLIAYKSPAKSVNYAAMMQGGSAQPSPAPILNSASRLDLALLNLRTTKGLSDVETVNTAAVIAESQQQSNQLAGAFKQTDGGDIHIHHQHSQRQFAVTNGIWRSERKKAGRGDHAIR